MLLLRQYPQIGKSIAQRFPLMIVDEAQDTSDIQMNILDSLIENGLENIVIVGDPDQAIFEWNKARPCLLYTSPSPRDQRGSRMPSSA